MERKIRVGIIAYELSALRGGPKFSFLVADQLQKAGFEVAMACVHHNKEFLKTKFPFIEDFKIYSSKWTFLKNKMNNLSAFWNHAPAVFKMCRDFKPDVVIETGGVITSLFVPMLFGIPTSHYCHYPASAYNLDYLNLQPLHKKIYQKFVKGLEIFFARRITKIMSNSNFTKRMAKSYWGADATVVNPPTDTSLFLPKNKENIILCVGFYNQIYNFDKLVEEFRKLKAADYDLYVVGPTYEQDKNRAQEHYNYLKEKYRDKNIHWLANINFKELLDLYGRARFFWHPNWAHFGNVIVESQSAGCVTLSFGRDSGPGEIIIDGKTGFVVDTHEEIRKKTDEIAGNAELLSTMSQSAIENARRFDIKKFREKLSALILGVVKA
ncbi:MAG: glycosyltransferase family 4 protein [DPANN group archaeon]|nr:glycosyltransferase family 4 protein [DPANN group archaeon]